MSLNPSSTSAPFHNFRGYLIPASCKRVCTYSRLGCLQLPMARLRLIQSPIASLRGRLLRSKLSLPLCGLMIPLDASGTGFAAWLSSVTAL